MQASKRAQGDHTLHASRQQLKPEDDGTHELAVRCGEGRGLSGGGNRGVCRAAPPTSEQMNVV